MLIEQQAVMSCCCADDHQDHGDYHGIARMLIIVEIWPLLGVLVWNTSDLV